jgi:hypothetical protein
MRAPQGRAGLVTGKNWEMKNLQSGLRFWEHAALFGKAFVFGNAFVF